MVPRTKAVARLAKIRAKALLSNQVSAVSAIARLQEDAAALAQHRYARNGCGGASGGIGIGAGGSSIGGG